MKSFKDYRDLEVWQRAIQITKQAYNLTRNFPQSELYGMTSQIRRASVSIAANIAEGWGRRYTAEFIQFLRQANGSRVELETHLIISAEVALCTQSEIQPMIAELETLGKQILSLERSLQRKKNSR